MTTRYSYFSHIEDLDSEILDLGDPFEGGRTVARVCRYELFRAPEALLHPDPETTGAARWRRVLPAPVNIPLPTHPIVSWQPQSWPLSGQIAGIIRLDFSRSLYFDVAFPMARSQGYTDAVCITSDPAAGHAFLNHDAGAGFDRRLMLPRELRDTFATIPGTSFFDEAAECAARTFQAGAKGAAVMGPWGNPYRLEGLKLVGMEIMEKYPDCMPTIVLHDPLGELTYALILAAGLYHGFHLERPPYRIILVQFRPFHGLCRRFEGEAVDWTHLEERANRRMLQPPNRYTDALVKGLIECRGTAVTLPAPEDGDNWLPEAVELLERTGFVDDEDTIIAIDAA